MNRKNLISEFINAVENERKTHNDGTHYWILGKDKDRNNWAIVLGWAFGFKADKDDDCKDGTHRLCVKLAYQPWNSLVQCDYDWDWLMPYDEESREVNDTEIAIYPDADLEEAINWLLDCYARYEN